ncbi:alr0857 family protein [Oscillatoria sp. FACHB-1406]|uniref:alr0857 family protein n=1 Tax=Oscillatoria sp. FACHB-1406 TaxID=2692846 RepID=UPI00168236FB|nr:alr0857 family protein [Oscillatoria sp. FACHB-1406]MBD2576858.1 hypothetical protein [Oscillatoria sp. FACHB-1406]
MLKLTYLENGFDLERLAQSLEDWVEVRVLVAMRSATAICVEPTTASFLLPIDLPYLKELEALAMREEGDSIALAVCDEEYIEVSLNGTWVSSAPDGEEGAFVTALSDRVEFFLFKLWQEAQSLASALRD